MIAVSRYLEGAGGGQSDSKVDILLIFEHHRKSSYGRGLLVTFGITTSPYRRLFGRFWIRWNGEIKGFPTDPKASKNMKIPRNAVRKTEECALNYETHFSISDDGKQTKTVRSPRAVILSVHNSSVRLWQTLAVNSIPNLDQQKLIPPLQNTDFSRNVRLCGALASRIF